MYSILIVDDTVENIDVLTGILKDDYSIKAATNGKTALKIAEKLKPDIILLDIMMPEMNGYEVCIKLKENPLTRRIPVIFVTAKDQEVDEVMGFAVGAVDYLTKPISQAIAKARIRTHLALSDQKKCLEMQVAEKTEELFVTRLEIIKKLGKAAEFRDTDTGFHLERMSLYSYHIAKEYGLEEEECQLLLNVAPMHDIGKIGIPDEVLKKPGSLESSERIVMQTHSSIGYDIIGDTDSELLKYAKIIALEHHERWNGEGYPNGLKADEINIFSRIVSVADVFDALVNKRIYKEAWSINDAKEYVIEESGKYFDPLVVEAFLRAFEKILEVLNKYKEK